MTNEVILIGGGGHCRACIEVIETTDNVIKGILDKEGAKNLSYPILGDDHLIEELIKGNFYFLIAIGQIKHAVLRTKLFNKVKHFNGKLTTIISSNAIVSASASVEEGTIIMHQALVNASVRIGKNCIINNKALIEHDSFIDDHTHVSTGALVNGNCKIGKRVFLGSNSVLVQGVEIFDDVVVGAGAVVVRSLKEPGTYVGNPAKKIK